MGNEDTINQRGCSVEGCVGFSKKRNYCIRHYVRLLKYGDPLIFRNYHLSFSRPDEIKDCLLKNREIFEDGCWEYTRGKNPNGYGMIKIDGKDYGVHRVSKVVFDGFDIRNPLHVLHTCDNPPCFNPNHLFYGTNTDNVLDKISKKRQWKPRGELHPLAKLKSTDIQKIRSMLTDKTPIRLIAPLFQVSAATIYDIKNGRSWFYE